MVLQIRERDGYLLRSTFVPLTCAGTYLPGILSLALLQDITALGCKTASDKGQTRHGRTLTYRALPCSMRISP